MATEPLYHVRFLRDPRAKDLNYGLEIGSELGSMQKVAESHGGNTAMGTNVSVVETAGPDKLVWVNVKLTGSLRYFCRLRVTRQ